MALPPLPYPPLGVVMEWLTALEDGSRSGQLEGATGVDHLQHPMRKTTRISEQRGVCVMSKRRIAASFYSDDSSHSPLTPPCLWAWCDPVCCIMTKYSPPPHQENKRKLSYDRSAAQFISNPPRCRSNFNLLVPQTGRRSQSINSPWSVSEGGKWRRQGWGEGKRLWWHSRRRKWVLLLLFVLSIVHSVHRWPFN